MEASILTKFIRSLETANAVNRESYNQVNHGSDKLLVNFETITEIYPAMIQFTTTILKFDKQGEKTGWMYISITVALAEKLNPGVKKSYRVKGKFDEYVFKGVSLLPMGAGDFIIPFNAAMRKGTRKRNGDKIKVQLEIDKKEYVLNPIFMECLADDPHALEVFKQMPRSYQNYYSKWIESAKTEATQTKRIAMAVNALAKKKDFGQMLRDHKKNKEDLTG